MLRFGYISEYDSSKGVAKVDFPEDGIVSDWLPISYPGAQSNKHISPLEVGEQVACLMDGRAEYGVIIGATYNAEDLPDKEVNSATVTGVFFTDGSYVYFDSEAGKFERKAAGAIFRMNQNLFTIKNETQSLKGLINELLDALVAETHPTPSGPSGPPNNLATYQAIKTKFEQLFEE